MVGKYANSEASADAFGCMLCDERDERTVKVAAGGRQEAATKYKNKLSRRGRILQRARLLRGLRVDQVLACADS